MPIIEEESDNKRKRWRVAYKDKLGKLADLLVGDLRATGISASIGAACTRSVDHKTRAAVYGAAERAMQSAKLTKGCAVATEVE